MLQYPFQKSANAFAKFSLMILALVILGSVGVATAFYHSPIYTGEGEQIIQPIEFSHKHHVKGLGLDCRYCHSGVETSNFAGLPDQATCLGCHSKVWKQSPMLEKIRDVKSGPLAWNQVIHLPDYVYFSHQVHVAKSIGCSTCHGEVSEMNSVVQTRSFLMRDCLSCHKDPSRFVRPREQIFNEAWDPLANPETARKAASALGVHPLLTTNCNLCHR